MRSQAGHLSVIGSLMALLISGCSVTSPAHRPPDLGFTIPPDWLAAQGESSQPSDRWWTSFGNEGLTEAVAEALANNRDLKAAAARIQTAAAEARIAGADLYPQASGSFGASRQRQNFNGTNTTSNTFGVSLDVSWEIDLWGRVRSNTRAAVADLQNAQATYAGARLSLAAQAAKAWLAVTEAKQQLDLAERTVTNYIATAKQATDRVDGGIQPPSDKHLAMTNLASAEGLLQQRREILDRARRQLEVLLGRYPAGLVEGAIELPGMPASPPIGLPAEVIRRRPDLVAAERRFVAASERVDVAEAALYPRISLTASGGASGSELKNLVSGDNFVWTLAGNLVQPIFEGGRLRARIEANEGRFKEEGAAFAQAALEAFSEVEDTLAAEQFLAERERALHVAAEQARLAVAVSQHRYAQGVENFIVVLESQRRALDADGALLAVRRERLETRINLHLALGGGLDEWMPRIVKDNVDEPPIEDGAR